MIVLSRTEMKETAVIQQRWAKNDYGKLNSSNYDFCNSLAHHPVLSEKQVYWIHKKAAEAFPDEYTTDEVLSPVRVQTETKTNHNLFDKRRN